MAEEIHALRKNRSTVDKRTTAELDVSMAGRSARVIGRSALSPRVTELTLVVEGEAPFRWVAGQHVTLRPDLPDGAASAFSLAAAPNQTGLDRLTLALANTAETLVHATVGARVFLEGPFGALVYQPAAGALLVGAGTGVAPLRAIVHDALGRDEASPLVLVAGNRSERDLLWHDELATLEREHERFRYEPVLSQAQPGFEGRRGRVQAHLAELGGSLPAGYRAYLCGSTAMVEDCRRTLARLGVGPDRILSEADA
jgi:NAD(P)H-flavin reductase